MALLKAKRIFKVSLKDNIVENRNIRGGSLLLFKGLNLRYPQKVNKDKKLEKYWVLIEKIPKRGIKIHG